VSTTMVEIIAGREEIFDGAAEEIAGREEMSAATAEVTAD
jgi:hypothetical protein